MEITSYMVECYIHAKEMMNYKGGIKIEYEYEWAPAGCIIMKNNEQNCI